MNHRREKTEVGRITGPTQGKRTISLGISQNKFTSENKKVIENLKNYVPAVNLDFLFMCGCPKLFQGYREAQ